MFINANRCWTLVLLMAGGVVVAATPKYDRLMDENIRYVGAFRVPPAPDSIAYASGMCAYDPTSDELILCNVKRLYGSVSIPKPVIGPLNKLPVASMRIPFTDLTQGAGQRDRMIWIEKGRRTTPRRHASVNAIHVDVNGDLFMCLQLSYNVGGHSYPTHMVARNDGTIEGPWFLGGSAHPNRVTGYITEIPMAWRDAFGGRWLSGSGPTQGRANASDGPAVYVHNMDGDEKFAKLRTVELMRYRVRRGPVLQKWPGTMEKYWSVDYHWIGMKREERATMAPRPKRAWEDAMHGRGGGFWPGNRGKIWNGDSRVQGAAFVHRNGRAAVVFVARFGLYPVDMYCTGDEFPQNQQLAADGTLCKKGTTPGHNTNPYEPILLLYDPVEMKNRSKVYAHKPYLVISLRRNMKTNCGNVWGCHDAKNGRLFVIERNGDTSLVAPRPLVHVYQID